MSKFKSLLFFKTPLSKNQRIHIFILFSLILITLNLRGPVTAVGPLMDDIARDLSSSSLAGALTTLVLALYAFGAPLSLRVFYIKMMLIGIFLIFIGVIIRSFGGDIFFIPHTSFFYSSFLFIGTFLLGVGISIGNVLIPVLIKKYFAKNIGLVTGIYGMSLSLSAFFGTLLALPLSRLNIFDFNLGYKGSLASWAILAFIALIFWLPLLRGSRLRMPFFIKTKKMTSNLYKNKDVWIITLFMGFQSLLFYTTVAWYVLFLTDIGFSLSFSSYMNSLIQLVSIPCAFFIPKIFTRLNPKARMLLVTSISTLYLISYILLSLHIKSEALAIAISLILPIPIGGLFATALLYIAISSTSINTSLFLSSFAQFGGYLLASFGPLIVGALYDFTKDFKSGIIFCIICSIILYLLSLKLVRVGKI